MANPVLRCCHLPLCMCMAQLEFLPILGGSFVVIASSVLFREDDGFLLQFFLHFNDNFLFLFILGNLVHCGFVLSALEVVVGNVSLTLLRHLGSKLCVFIFVPNCHFSLSSFCFHAETALQFYFGDPFPDPRVPSWAV